MNFTLDHYKKTLEEYLTENYDFQTVNNITKSTKKIYMVHDVDHKIEFSKKFSEIEKSLGIKSTYFLRLHAQNYNMLSYSSIKVAEEILKNGHEIGLHYEPGFSKTSNHSENIVFDMDLLSRAVSSEVNTFNIHEPARTGVDLGRILEKNNRCYNSAFFENFKYISDSGCRWREGCFSEHINRWDQLLVLTHPFWWYYETPSENY